jgi:hypothetical protein
MSRSALIGGGRSNFRAQALAARFVRLSFNRSQAVEDKRRCQRSGDARSKKMTDERRTQERVKIVLEARWEGLAGRHEARLSDLSSGGCFIESIGQVQLQELVRFEIQLPWGRWLPLQGEVVYRQSHFGFAIRLTELSEMQRRQFNALFAYAKAAASKST